MVPSELVDVLLKRLFHLVGTLLGNHRAQCIGNEYAHHIALLFESLLISFILHATGTHKERISLGTTQLANYNLTHIKGRQLTNDKITELRT